MKRAHRITTFGLTKEQNEIVRANIPMKDYEVFDTDAPTDVIAHACVAMIIQASAMDEESIDMIFDLYMDVDGCFDETVIWLGEPAPPKELRKVFKCYPSFSDIEDSLKYILLNAHRQTKNAEEYSEKFYYGLKIISLIRSCPGIKTKEIGEKLELSSRTVQRYINALRIAGEWIEYDASKKGWKLMANKSVFFGDY